MIAETHMPQGDMLIRDIIERMRHDGCGGRAGKVELLTGIEGVSRRRPVRRIVLVGAGGHCLGAARLGLWCRQTAGGVIPGLGEQLNPSSRIRPSEAPILAP